MNLYESIKYLQEGVREYNSGSITYKIPTDFNADSENVFVIPYVMKGNRHITNEPFEIPGEHAFIYEPNENAVYTAYNKEGTYVKNNWGVYTNVTRDDWKQLTSKPENSLIPWVEGASLD